MAAEDENRGYASNAGIRGEIERFRSRGANSYANTVLLGWPGVSRT